MALLGLMPLRFAFLTPHQQEWVGVMNFDTIIQNFGLIIVIQLIFAVGLMPVAFLARVVGLTRRL